MGKAEEGREVGSCYVRTLHRRCESPIRLLKRRTLSSAEFNCVTQCFEESRRVVRLHRDSSLWVGEANLVLHRANGLALTGRGMSFLYDAVLIIRSLDAH
jgi:hypothetical protein